MNRLKNSRFIISELKLPPEKLKTQDRYRTYANRVLWMDDQVVEGAFHMNTAWYLHAAATLEDKPHVHDTDEIIGFFGNNPDEPLDLGGEIEIWLEDEAHILQKSSLIFVPAGLVHCPLILCRVDRPIFHFTTLPHGAYIKNEKTTGTDPV